MTDRVLFDSHAHLISPDRQAYPPSLLRGATAFAQMDYSVTAEWLLEQMGRHGVAKACAVQRGHLYGYDNRYVIDAAQAHPDRLACVVILDAQDPATPAMLRNMVMDQGVKGLRLAQTRIDAYDTAWMNSPAAMDCWAMAAELGIPVAIIFFRRHLAYGLAALELIAQLHPDLPIIVDHSGTPYNAANYEVGWYRDHGLSNALPGPPDFGIDDTVARLAPYRNVHVKITEITFDRLADGGVEPSRFVRRLADTFGANRLMWGSDVGQSDAPYSQKAAMAQAAAAELSAQERGDFLFGTADRLYFGRPPEAPGSGDAP
jgi:predicted TIM-barrel fold metal-dependent hydrolase